MTISIICMVAGALFVAVALVPWLFDRIIRPSVAGQDAINSRMWKIEESVMPQRVRLAKILTVLFGALLFAVGLASLLVVITGG